MMSNNQIKDLILNFEFAQVEKVFRDQNEKINKNAYLNLGILGIIRTFISKSDIDFNLAIIELDEAQKKSENNFNTFTLQLYPEADTFTYKSLQLSNDPHFINDSKDIPFSHTYAQRLISEISASECILLKIFLKCIFHGEHSHFISFLLSESELKTFRLAFMTAYHAFERFSRLPKDNAMNSLEYIEYRDGIYLTWGLCNLLILLLPSELAIILGTSEFQLPTVSHCFDVIKLGVSGKSLHSILANLVLITSACDLTENLEAAKMYLELLQDSKSTMSQYFQSKIMRLDRNTFGGIECLKKIRITSHIVQYPVYWQMIQCFAESQRWPEAIQYIKALRQGGSAFPSKIFSLYLEASFMQASTGSAIGPLSIEVQHLLKKIVKASREKHTVPRPFLDRLAIFRARCVLERNEHFYLPHFEILLLWNRLKNNIEHVDFIIKQVRKSLESSGKLTFEQQTLGWLILAVLSETSDSAMKLIMNHIIPRERALPSASFCLIRAKCELAHRSEDFSKILKEIEMIGFDKIGFPGQGTILTFLFRLKHISK